MDGPGVETPPGRQKGCTVAFSISQESGAILSPFAGNKFNQMDSALLVGHFRLNNLECIQPTPTQHLFHKGL